MNLQAGQVLDPTQMNYLAWIQQTNPRFNPSVVKSAGDLSNFKQLVNTPTNAQNVQQKMMDGLMHPPPGAV